MTSEASKSVGRWTLVATVLGSAMAFIDGTVVNVALPVLQRDLSASLAGAQWVIEAYAVVLAALILVGGALGDRYGRRRIFFIGVLLFATASAACGVAQTIGQLIVARSLQGVGGALLTPGSLSIIEATFSPADRGRAIGTWAGFSALTSALGPVLGGWLIDHAGWRWVFFLNIPLAAITVGVTLWRVPESRDEADPPLDLVGAALATIGLGLIVYGLVEAGATVTSRGIAAVGVLAGVAMVLGVLSLVTFVAVERRSRAPMIPLDLFASRAFVGVNLLTLLLYAALSGALFFLPYNLLQVQHYSATVAGAALIPIALLLATLSGQAGAFATRYGARGPLVVGPMVAAVGLAMLGRPGVVVSGYGSYWTTFFPAITILGLGLVIAIAPLTAVAMSSVPARRAGLASGVNNAVARTAAVLAIALLGLVWSVAFRTRLDARLVARGSPVTERTRVATLGVRALDDAAVRDEAALAFVGAFRVVTTAAAGLALAGAVAAALLIPSATGKSITPRPD